MKAKILLTSLMSLLLTSSFAQDKTTVNAMSSEISDNLDLRAIASIFGDSENLEDFEKRLNDPKMQLSNLDLNNDDQVDYLRVIETVEGRAHLIVVQSVLGKDLFQDVATIEVEKDDNNRVQVQVVGNVYMYGDNYIYEPVYVRTPIIYDNFWVSSYRPYYSSWYWGYYPSYYTFWNPYPVFRYRNNVAMWINYDYQYNYVNYRRCHVAYNNYYHRRGNGFERHYPNRSFSNRNSGYTNRYELEKTRSTTRKDVAYNTTRNIDRNSTVRSNSTTRNENSTVRETTRAISNQTRSQNVKFENSPVRENTRAIGNQTRSQNVKFENSPVRENTRAISNQTRSNSNVQTKIESSSRSLGLQSSRYSENRSQSETSRANSGSGRR
jgi:DNA-dependent RNA polymerase auxiliary subunit epsilon